MKRKTNVLNDYEVLGIGAQRKHQLLMFSADADYVLKTHDHSFLPGLLDETMAWLKPLKVEAEKNWIKEEVLGQAFTRIFSEGHRLLGDTAAKLLQDYLSEMPWTEGLLEDHFRYFAFFLRSRFPKEPVWSEVFSWEFLRNSLTYQDFGSAHIEGKVLKTNPSLSTLQIETSAQILKRNPGLYAFVYSSNQHQVIERQLRNLDAEILDLLAEDRKFSREQVLSHLMMEKVASNEEIVACLDSLIQSDIISAS